MKRMIDAIRAWLWIRRQQRRNERAYRAYMEDQDEPGYAYEDHR